MTSKLIIRHSGRSSLAGRTMEFLKPALRIGRRPDNDIAFDAASDTAVSGYHAEVLLDGGHVVLRDLNSRNGTYVNDQRVRDPREIGANDRIRLGSDGPTLSIEARVEGVVMATLDAPIPALAQEGPKAGPEPIVARNVATAQAAMHRGFRGGAVGPIPIFGHGGRSDTPAPSRTPHCRSAELFEAAPAGLAHRVTLARRAVRPLLKAATVAGRVLSRVCRERVTARLGRQISRAGMSIHPFAGKAVSMPGNIWSGPPEHPPAPAGLHAGTAKPSSPHSELGRPSVAQVRDTGRGIGMNTLMGVVRSAQTRERRRSLTIALPVVALVLTAIGIGWRATQPTDWSRVLSRVGDSVYLVIKVDEHGHEEKVGTAWSIAKGKLATNSHVAEERVKAGGKMTFLARSRGINPQTLNITAVAMHPGYTQFQTAIKLQPPVDTQSRSGFLELVPACDVALLILDDESAARQAAPLPLASDLTLARLVAGSEVGYVGFPAEDTVATGTDIKHPEPKSEPGFIRGLTDEFMGATTPDLATTLSYSIKIAGGASGSPVVNARGEVVACMSAADTIMEHRRIQGASYGPRIDLVKELLNDTVTVRQTVRAARWAKDVPKRCAESLGDGSAFVAQRAERLLAQNGLEIIKESLVVRSNSMMTIRMGEAGQSLGEARLAPGQALMIVAASLDGPCNLNIEARGPAFGEKDYVSLSDGGAYFSARLIGVKAAGSVQASLAAVAWDEDETHPISRNVRVIALVVALK